jgi:protein-L-isoaspartate(D-aspartate) O-methyltransferase
LADGWQRLHLQMLDYLTGRGYIRTASIEAAFRRLPRHLFLPDVPLARVYDPDAAVGIKAERGVTVSSSSAPVVMALMLETLELGPGHRVLEIGAGTGFNAALIGDLVGPSGRVVTLDIDPEICAVARGNLRQVGDRPVEVVCADGGYGYAPAAPYNRIIVTVGSAELFPHWLEQLAPGGLIAAPLSLRGCHVTVTFRREGDRLISRTILPLEWVSLRGDFARSDPLRLRGGWAVQAENPAGLEAGLLEPLLNARATPRPDLLRPLSGEQLAFSGGLPLFLAGADPRSLTLVRRSSAGYTGMRASALFDPAGPGIAAVSWEGDWRPDCWGIGSPAVLDGLAEYLAEWASVTVSEPWITASLAGAGHGAAAEAGHGAVGRPGGRRHRVEHRWYTVELEWR